MSSRDLELREAMAQRLHRLRGGRGWSLDELGRRSGVSKGVLVQIEQGQGNPSLATLVRISDALETTVTQLIDGGPEETPARVVRAGGGSVLWADERGSSVRHLLGMDHDDHVELWSWRLAPGAAYPSEPHAAGTVEMARVERGRLRLDVAGHRHELGPGDAIRYRGDVAHGFANAGRGVLEFTMVVITPAV